VRREDEKRKDRETGFEIGGHAGDNYCTCPLSARESSARCTVRWLDPIASSSAEAQHYLTAGEEASTQRAPLRPAAPARRPHARATRPPPQPFVASRSRPATFEAPSNRPISTRNRARCDSSANFCADAPREASWPSARLGPRFAQARSSANNNRTLASEITLRSSARHKTACVHADRFDATRFDILDQEAARSSPRSSVAPQGVAEDERRAFRPRPSGRGCRRPRARLSPTSAVRASSSAGVRIAIPERQARVASLTPVETARDQLGERNARRRPRSPIMIGRRSFSIARCAAFTGRRSASSVARACVKRLAVNPNRARASECRPRDDTARARIASLSRRPPPPVSESLRRNEIAELRHRDAAKLVAAASSRQANQVMRRADHLAASARPQR